VADDHEAGELLGTGNPAGAALRAHAVTETEVTTVHGDPDPVAAQGDHAAPLPDRCRSERYAALGVSG
jgi:hypothetical protein